MTATETTIIRDVPLSKLVASAKNVRRTRVEAGIEELAASIAAHGLLQSLSVRPVLDAEGTETGRFSVTGGARRLAALKLLAKRKRLAKSYAVPCLIHDGDEEEVSLAENVVRENLHPADQFEAFKRLADERGAGVEEIAARFGVTPQIVRQRLRLGAVSPKLMQIYRDGGLTLDQLTAFAISEDHDRQEQVYHRLSWNKEPQIIRRLMTESHIRAGDRRAVFVGADAYAEAGGTILRDLFAEDGGGYFEDGALLDRLALEKLETVAAEIRAEGWKWVLACLDYPHAHGLARYYPQPAELPPEDQERLDAAQAELDGLNEHHDGAEELPEEAESRFGELETEIARLSERQVAYDPEMIVRAGAFVVLNHDGNARIERGFVRPEDEAPEPVAENQGEDGAEPVTDADAVADEDGVIAEDRVSAPDAEDEDDGDGKPLSDLLIRDLTAHRTLGLRLALGEQPDIALIAVTHALASQTLYRGDSGACLDLSPVCSPLGGHAEGIEDTEAGKALADRHAFWAAHMPKDPGALWAFVTGLAADDRLALFAHCAALTVFAVSQPWDRKPRALATADRLATVLRLDMTMHWRPTLGSYLGRVTKAQILAAVREGVSEEAAHRLTGLKKPAMAEAAELLLAGTGWLPPLLRTAPLPEMVAQGGRESHAIDETADIAAE
ncbi:MAG: ParB/RepB/Spo0J family partition protein [Aliidongia sp.]